MIGLFASFEHNANETEEEERLIESLSEEFRKYIWGDNGLKERLGNIGYEKYGQDLELILFQFLVFPSIEALSEIEEVEKYRPREKAVGVNVAVAKEDFFDKDEQDRREFLRSSLINGLDLVSKAVVEKNGLDTNMALLKEDVLRSVSK